LISTTVSSVCLLS
ncbi:unnamed protein product, partial [Rotaria sp. Silwood1]